MVTTRSTRRASAVVAGRPRHDLERWSTSRDATHTFGHKGFAVVVAASLAAVVAVPSMGQTVPSFGAAPAPSYGQSAATAGGIAALGAGPPSRLVLSIAYETTLTDNVNLDSNRKADWVNQFTPTLSFNEASAHTRFAGSLSLPILLYARTSENNYVAPSAAIAGTVELVDKFFFIDTAASVSQQFRTPFGAVSNSLANSTDNRYTAQAYTISPYIRGLLAGDLDYELRDTNTWSPGSGVSDSAGTSYVNQLNGHITRQARPLGWSVEYDRARLNSDARRSEITSILRTFALYRPDPTLQFSASIGYENNQFVQTTERGVTYGIGATWHPTERTSVDGRVEHRFFGAGYKLDFEHRTPLTVWSVRASRDTTSYPAELATLPGGGNVPGLLDALLLSKVPDPAQRQSLVDQIIRERGLPTSLQGPVTLYSSQVALVEAFTASFGILGARNSVLFTAYRSRNEPVGNSSLSEVTGILSAINNSTQVGASAVYTHQFAADLMWGTNLTVSRSTSNFEPREVTDLFQVSSVVSHPLTAFTSIYAGARVQQSRSDVASGYTEFAVFAGITHTFH